jgi:hypothetical protein
MPPHMFYLTVLADREHFARMMDCGGSRGGER